MSQSYTPPEYTRIQHLDDGFTYRGRLLRAEWRETPKSGTPYVALDFQCDYIFHEGQWVQARQDGQPVFCEVIYWATEKAMARTADYLRSIGATELDADEIRCAPELYSDGVDLVCQFETQQGFATKAVWRLAQHMPSGGRTSLGADRRRTIAREMRASMAAATPPAAPAPARSASPAPAASRPAPAPARTAAPAAPAPSRPAPPRAPAAPAPPASSGPMPHDDLPFDEAPADELPPGADDNGGCSDDEATAPAPPAPPRPAAPAPPRRRAA